MNTLAQAGYPRLAEAGYEYTDRGVMAPGANKPITDPELLDKLEGRLDNIEYMAKAIDIFDTGASDVAGTQSGQNQFDHLINTPHLVLTGYLYVALRRFQRCNRPEALRAGLAMLLTAELGLVGEKDLVASMAPDLVQKEDIREDDLERQLVRRAAQLTLERSEWKPE